jgi:hypothetical protein
MNVLEKLRKSPKDFLPCTIRMLWLLPLFFTLSNAALFGVYSDATCETLVLPVLAHTDVCTWNTYTTSYSLYLNSCSSEEFNVTNFNLLDSPVCEPSINNQTFVVKATCEPTFDYYTKILDSRNCLGLNTTYNIVAHDTANCSDSGVPFSVFNNQDECVGNSFGPGLQGASFDTRIYQTNTTFLMEVFASTNGTCQQNLDVFAAKNLGDNCLAPLSGPDSTLFVQVWNAFPIPV